LAAVQYKYVFSPFRIGNIEVKNRIETSPMLSEMATPDGFVSREIIEYHQSFARGGVGIVTIGDSMINQNTGHYSQLYLGDDRIIAGLGNLVEAIHKYGAKASVELNFHVTSPTALGGGSSTGPASKPTARRKPRFPAPVTEVMDQKLIDQVKNNYADAAYRCMVAGFQIIMIHGAHGQPLAQFASPLTNKRKDKYGGSLANRARFAIEVLDAIRKRVGNCLAIEYRVSGSEIDPGGMHEAETIEFVKLIQDKVDLIHVSLGIMPRYITSTMQTMYFPHEFNVHRAAAIKKAIHIPVTCVGSIGDLATADRIIAEGKADMVAMGRALIADPEIVSKTYRGEADNVRPCLRCNLCGEQTSHSRPIRCAVNPVRGREVEYNHIPPSKKRRKVVIVGGGPAGMEAALIASSRGHQVTLYEQESELGGALRYAAAPPFKDDTKRFLNWMIAQIKQAPVEIKLGTRATAQNIKMSKPDVLIIAIGAEPYKPEIAGINQSNVVLAGDVDMGKANTGKKVVVAGGGLTGCETALHLATQGKQVTIIDVLKKEELAQDAAQVARLTLMDLLHEHGVAFKTEVKLEEITSSAAIVTDKKGKSKKIPAENIVLALGVKSLADNVKIFRKLALENNIEFYPIGDCSNPRNIMAAIHDGFNVTAEL
jgi:2,4-dienoyl-CoA reductase-like NADH-dependent reductase (Old Yellow Enzyme family)/NADPH-dependent 2,4-dienoyl-CoA reductase/sulfur reductase-like enzyme